jgi:hypothetical protein
MDLIFDYFFICLNKIPLNLPRIKYGAGSFKKGEAAFSSPYPIRPDLITPPLAKGVHPEGSP